MKVYETKDIRNVGIAGHGHCGKTSVVAGLLFAAGATNRLTRVDEGNTITDNQYTGIVFSGTPYGSGNLVRGNVVSGNGKSRLPLFPGTKIPDLKLAVEDQNVAIRALGPLPKTALADVILDRVATLLP